MVGEGRRELWVTGHAQMPQINWGVENVMWCPRLGGTSAEPEPRALLYTCTGATGEWCGQGGESPRVMYPC